MSEKRVKRAAAYRQDAFILDGAIYRVSDVHPSLREALIVHGIAREIMRSNDPAGVWINIKNGTAELVERDPLALWREAAALHYAEVNTANMPGKRKRDLPKFQENLAAGRDLVAGWTPEAMERAKLHPDVAREYGTLTGDGVPDLFATVPVAVDEAA